MRSYFFSHDEKKYDRKAGNGPCAPPSKRSHRACPSRLARAGLSCGTRGFRLRLLPSGPDLVRVPTSRRTRPSTPPAAHWPRRPAP